MKGKNIRIVTAIILIVGAIAAIFFLVLNNAKKDILMFPFLKLHMNYSRMLMAVR